MSVVAENLPTKEDFSSQVDSVFRAHTGQGEGFDLSLVKFNEVVSNETQESFTLLFRAPVNTQPIQMTYRLEHDGLGSMDLFLVPIERDDHGLYFEAVFNSFVAA